MLSVNCLMLGGAKMWLIGFQILVGERERANLIVQRARFFWYIYIYIYIYLSRAMPYRKPSTRFQINATYDISQKFTTCV